MKTHLISQVILKYLSGLMFLILLILYQQKFRLLEGLASLGIGLSTNALDWKPSVPL